MDVTPLKKTIKRNYNREPIKKMYKINNFFRIPKFHINFLLFLAIYIKIFNKAKKSRKNLRNEKKELTVKRKTVEPNLWFFKTKNLNRF